MMRVARRTTTTAVALALGLSGQARAFSCAAWNLESGDSEDSFLAEQIREWRTIDVWGLSEVRDERTLEALGNSLNGARPEAAFRGVMGTTGGQDRLGIIFSSQTFECKGAWELHDINLGGSLRAPLVAQLREIATGREFLFVANHLYRGKSGEEPRRDEQARLLREWAKAQPLPVIAVGDFNFDCQVEGMGQCNNAYRVLAEGGFLRWAQPENPMRTQCNRRYNAILDFVFVSRDAVRWVSRSLILGSEESFCDDDASRSDHRPVAVEFATN
jgi:endonuclease/exonuclease/phosphatase family metal-dependent hydrolase